MPIDAELLERIKCNDSKLTNLDLSGQRLTNQDVKKLLEALAGNKTLTSLDLGSCKIEDEGAKALAGNKTLISLDLSDCYIRNEGVKALAANKTLTSLNLHSNYIGAEGVKALAGNKTLISLDISECTIRDEGAKALAGNETLTSLNLSFSMIKDEGAKALAGNETLTSLNLGSCKIGAEGAKALAGNKTLTSLNLSGNVIGAEGAKALAGNKTLTSLNLNLCKIGDEGAKELARNKTLTSLDLHRNEIRAEGAKALAGNKTLTSLNLNLCKIGDEGAKELARNKTLTSLDLHRNEIRAEGAKALAGNKTLTSLNLSGNVIGAEGAKALAGNKTLTSFNGKEIGNKSAKAADKEGEVDIHDNISSSNNAEEKLTKKRKGKEEVEDYSNSLTNIPDTKKSKTDERSFEALSEIENNSEIPSILSKLQHVHNQGISQTQHNPISNTSKIDEVDCDLKDEGAKALDQNTNLTSFQNPHNNFFETAVTSKKAKKTQKSPIKQHQKFNDCKAITDEIKKALAECSSVPKYLIERMNELKDKIEALGDEQNMTAKGNQGEDYIFNTLLPNRYRLRFESVRPIDDKTFRIDGPKASETERPKFNSEFSHKEAQWVKGTSDITVKTFFKGKTVAHKVKFKEVKTTDKEGKFIFSTSKNQFWNLLQDSKNRDYYLFENMSKKCTKLTSPRLVFSQGTHNDKKEIHLQTEKAKIITNNPDEKPQILEGKDAPKISLKNSVFTMKSTHKPG